MSDLKALDYYNKKENKPDFTMLTRTGIKTNYEKVFEFAETYYDARKQANEVNSENPNCADVNTRTCDTCSYCLYEKSKAKHEQHTCLFGTGTIHIANPTKHTCNNWRE